MSGRHSATYDRAEKRPVILFVTLGVIGIMVIVMAVFTIFAWSQWIEGWPILEIKSPLSNEQSESLTSKVEQAEISIANPDSSDATSIIQFEVQSTPLAINPIEPKPIIAGSVSQRSRWTPTPLPTITPTPTPSPMPTFVSGDVAPVALQPMGLQPGEKWIDVNVSSQTLVAYEGSAPVFNTLVSTGTSRYPTVTGQFRIWLRFQSQDMNGYRLGYDYYLKGVPFVQYFFEDYALHGTFWHSNFGTPMSHGCVNLSPSAAEWLYNWASYGTLVNIHK